MPKVKINDIEVEVPNGANMIEAAAKAGVSIPHYCYHPHLSVAGNCRMCLVEPVGGRGLEIACNMQARDGMAIRTDTPAVKNMQKSVMEFLLVNHPLDCPICDQSGECRLQDYYMDYGQHDSRLSDGKVSKHKRQDIGELLVLDAERCVQCSRCVRFGDEVTQTGDLRLMNRGDHTEIGLFPGERVQHNYQGCLADICPVGALTNKDFRFQKRVWYLKETPSVCTGCATGCNINVCHQEGEVFRFTPRRNDAVNKSWMCDEGRMSYKQIASMTRQLKASVDGKDATLDAAIAEVGRRIRGVPASAVGVVLGAQATNEANWALLSLVRANLPGARVFASEGVNGAADQLLVDADKAPNTAGVRLLKAHDGKVEDSAALKAALGELKLLVVLEDDVVSHLGGGNLPPMVVLSTWSNLSTRGARIVLPTAHAVEMEGTYINRVGRIQRVRRALAPAGDSQPAYQILDRIGAALGKAPGTAMPVLAFNTMARAVARMRGIDFKSLGTEGRDLLPDPAQAGSAGVMVQG